MKSKTLWIILAVIVIFLIGTFIYNNVKGEPGINDERQEAINQEIQRPETTINVKRQYKDGMHTFVGSIELPNPCYAYNAEVKKNENVTEIALTTTEPNPETDQVCEEVITERAFKVSFEGSAEENIIATLNGELVNLNIFEVGLDEDINDVDIYFKG